MTGGLIHRRQQTRWNLQEAVAEQVQDEDLEIVLSPGSAISRGRERDSPWDRVISNPAWATAIYTPTDTGGINPKQTNI